MRYVDFLNVYGNPNFLNTIGYGGDLTLTKEKDVFFIKYKNIIIGKVKDENGMAVMELTETMQTEQTWLNKSNLNFIINTDEDTDEELYFTEFNVCSKKVLSRDLTEEMNKTKLLKVIRVIDNKITDDLEELMNILFFLTFKYPNGTEPSKQLYLIDYKCDESAEITSDFIIFYSSN